MSYSFEVKAPTKALVLEQASAKLDEVAATQPMHSHDRGQAQGAVESFVGVLPDDEDGKDFVVSVSGSVGWTDRGGEVIVNSASIHVNAYLVDAAKTDAS